MKIVCNNKKAFHNFFVSDFLEAGVQLEGSEVKSVRDGGVSLTDSFVVIKNGEAWLKNCYIKTYDNTSSFIPDTRRSRRLLIHKDEITKLEQKTCEKGYSIVPTKLYIDDHGRVKVEIALAKGKKLYDKRETLKDKAITREIQRALKEP